MKFKYPAIPKAKKGKGGVEIARDMEQPFPDEWERTIHIPVSKEQLDALKVGDSATIVLTGEVTGLESREREKGKNRTMMDMKIAVVETAGGNEFEQMANEMDTDD